MSKAAFAACISSALLAVLAVLHFRQTSVQEQLATNIAVLQQISTQANQALEQERAALREARQELLASREREAQRAEAEAKVRRATSLTDAPDPVIAPGSGRGDAAVATAAMLNYLGEPVAAPQNLDPKYGAEAVLAAFKGLCEARGIEVRNLGVDTTEFPFVLHGVVADARDFFPRIKTELATLPGYDYAGSVTGGTRDGGTYFALNMTPHRQYPREDAETIHRRLMIRLQMLAAAWMPEH